MCFYCVSVFLHTPCWSKYTTKTVSGIRLTGDYETSSLQEELVPEKDSSLQEELVAEKAFEKLYEKLEANGEFMGQYFNVTLQV